MSNLNFAKLSSLESENSVRDKLIMAHTHETGIFYCMKCAILCCSCYLFLSYGRTCKEFVPQADLVKPTATNYIVEQGGTPLGGGRQPPCLGERMRVSAPRSRAFPRIQRSVNKMAARQKAWAFCSTSLLLLFCCLAPLLSSKYAPKLTLLLSSYYFIYLYPRRVAPCHNNILLWPL